MRRGKCNKSGGYPDPLRKFRVLNRFGETPVRLRKKIKAAQKIKLLLTEYLKNATVRLVIRVIREDFNLGRSRGV
jgi:hypothetical protein